MNAPRAIVGNAADDSEAAARMREEPEFRRLLKGPAHAEALAAFRERRAPDFSKIG